jgi:hypothetical protein
MALFTKKEFEELANASANYCISIYIPTNRVGENDDSAIRLKNQLTSVQSELVALGLKSHEVEAYTAPIAALLENSSLWRKLSDALLIFRNKDMFQYYTLPIQANEFSIVSDQYYLLPLLNLFGNNDSFFVFVLSQHHNKLYKATRHEIQEVETNGLLPENINDTVGGDVEQKSLQYRSHVTRRGHGIFHGQGEGKDDKDTEVTKYLYDVANGLEDLLEGYDLPLVVASVEDIYAEFRDICSYKNIYPKYISGNYEHANAKELHAKAISVLQTYFNEVKNENKHKVYEFHVENGPYRQIGKRIKCRCHRYLVCFERSGSMGQLSTKQRQHPYT